MGQDLVKPTPAPDPLPTFRSRRLTIRAIPDSGMEDINLLDTKSQTQSPLFSTLPLELRLSLYHHVIGGEAIHIVPNGPRISHAKCSPLAERSWPGGPCKEGWNISSTKTGKTKDVDHRSTRHNENNVIPLLQTCRAIYTEAIDIPYSTNEFHFVDTEHLIHFSTTILPQRLDAIRSVRVWTMFAFHPLYSTKDPQEALPPPQDEATWERFCGVLASLTGLRELRVELMTSKFWNHAMRVDCEERMLKPLWDVRSSAMWELVVYWPVTAAIAEGAPFRVVQRQEPGDQMGQEAD